ncbi:hypothetical protein NFI96_020501 [Prochilodus magdalenae]|nr:hypothetical protein NFI96_020501 [Prochilodus magdalenae]
MESMDSERGPGEITGNESGWMELNNPGDGGSSEEEKEKIEEALPLGGKDTERRSPGAACCSDSSDEAGGDEADGDEASGDEAGGDEASGDETGGDETSGDEVGGDEADGDEASGDEASGDEAGGDEVGGDEVSGDEAIGDEAGGDEATGDGAIGDEASGNEATGDGAIGDEAGGDEASGDEAGWDEVGGDDLSGDEAGGHEASGNEAGRDEAGGDEMGGDEASGFVAGGDEVGGDEAGRDEAGRDETGGDKASGDEAGGDEAGGDEAGQDEAGWDEAGRDEAGGDEASWDAAGWDEAGRDEAGGDEASPVPLLASDDSEAGSHDGLRSVKASTDENNQRTEPPSEHGSGMDLSETSSEDGEDDGDHDDPNSEVSEEDEEHPEELYCQPAYPTQVFQALEEMKQSSFLTDLLLRTTSGFSVRAHSLVLAAVSSLVRKMLQESYGEMVLRLGAEVSALGLSAVLEFAYTGTITGLDGQSLAQIRMAAYGLGVPRVLELCRKEEEVERKTDDGQEGKVEEVSAEDQLKLSLESIRQLWEDRVGCDVELEAEGRIFRVHKVLLAASSDYFRAMFGSGMRESQQTSVTLLLMGAAELGILLECSYSGTLVLDWDVVFELTCTALQFQFQPALSLCLGFMQQDMDAHSCLDVAAFAEAYGMSDLRDAAEDFVLRRFEEVSATLKFQDLPVDKLKTYLHSSSLCVKSELPVFKAVVSWIGANPRRRVREARELLATVHFPLMTFKEFREVKAITSWPKVHSEDLYDSLLEEFCSGTSDVHSDFRTYLPKDALVLVGGERITDDFDKRVPCRDIWFSNSFRNHVGVMKRVEWRRLGDLPEKPRFSHAVGVIGGQLYVVGGRHYYGRTDTMRSTYR